jgi:hypothetical protein
MAIPICFCILVGIRRSVRLTDKFNLGSIIYTILPVVISKPLGVPDLVMVGLLLENGSIVEKYQGGGTYLKFAQGMIDNGYLNHVFDLFKAAGHLSMPAASFGKS